jgi:hypothetical protein
MVLFDFEFCSYDTKKVMFPISGLIATIGDDIV